MREGDCLIGLVSNGAHSNGYSLARKVLFEHAKLGFLERPRELGGQTVGEALLTPTVLYARAVQALLGGAVDVHAMSHVTGGGIPGNVPRVLPEGLGVRLGIDWARPPIFDLIARLGGVSLHEMRRAFNMGIGFVVVVAAADAERAVGALRNAGVSSFEMGRIVRVPRDRPFEERVEWPA